MQTALIMPGRLLFTECLEKQKCTEHVELRTFASICAWPQIAMRYGTLSMINTKITVFWYKASRTLLDTNILDKPASSFFTVADLRRRYLPKVGT